MTSSHHDHSQNEGDSNTVRGDIGVRATFRDYFLQYASYVITERAIPDVEDGLKPVQRRILHSLWENEDGRYNKVANIVGHTMKYHPHGDASIYSAMVALGQKELLIDTQGNWGSPATGDSAAAARYIEARLTKFAKEVAFAPHLTSYAKSYDGRNREPVTLPVRFPLLLATGAEGIAVGLTTRILPHNFIELLEAQKAWFQGASFQLFPDFPTGGLIDVEGYNDGRPGSKVKVRALIEPSQGKKLVIRKIPYATTTESVIDSILSANDKGKIKVAHIEDNTAAEIEIVVTFQRGVDMDKAADALYAFTQCEVSLTSTTMVIQSGHPQSLTTSEILIENAKRTRRLLRLDLEIQQERSEREWHLKSLVQIFVENRIFLSIEKCKTWDAVLYEIDQGLEPYKSKLRRDVTEADLVFLTEVKMRRISAWDAEKSREQLLAIDRELARVRKDLRSLTQYTIRYLDHLLENYSQGRERKTTISSFDSVAAVSVVERTEKLYMDRKGGFLGTDSKIGEELGPCSSLDDVLVILSDGGLVITRTANKKYVGEGILHAQFFRPQNREDVFNLVYLDLASGSSYVKRFQVGGVTRDRRYELGKSNREKSARIFLVSQGAGHLYHVKLRKKPRIKTDLYISINDYPVKGRGANGITLTKHMVSSVREITPRVYENRMAEEAVKGQRSLLD